MSDRELVKRAREAWDEWVKHGDAEDARECAGYVPGLADAVERLMETNG
jgi:hypothetical protein